MQLEPYRVMTLRCEGRNFVEKKADPCHQRRFDDSLDDQPVCNLAGVYTTVTSAKHVAVNGGISQDDARKGQRHT